MRAIALLALCLCLRGYAQTNIISFTNSSGAFIQNATAVKIAENKLMYTYDKGGGIVRLATLPDSIRLLFHFNQTNAWLADQAEQKRKFDQSLEGQFQAAMTPTKEGQADLDRRIAIMRTRFKTINGFVVQKVNDGLIVDCTTNRFSQSFAPLNPTTNCPAIHEVILLRNWPDYEVTADGDFIATNAFLCGTFDYMPRYAPTTTIHSYTADSFGAFMELFDEEKAKGNEPNGWR